MTPESLAAAVRRRTHVPLPALSLALVVVLAVAAGLATGAAKRRPDLVVASVTDPPRTLAPGGSLSLGAAVANRGRAASRASAVTFYLSADRRRDAGDVRLSGRRTVVALKARRRSYRTTALRVPASARVGSYLVLACADVARKIAEARERNNCRPSARGLELSKPVVGGPVVAAPVAASGGTGQAASSEASHDTGSSGGGTTSPPVSGGPRPEEPKPEEPEPEEPKPEEPQPEPPTPQPPTPELPAIVYPEAEVVPPPSSGPVVPPAPPVEQIAPPTDATATSTPADLSKFLYEGENPPQSGVEQGAIQEQSAAVVRGVVRSRGGGVLPGVRVSVLDHPELGHTATRADGGFDMAVNGGGRLTLVLERNGYLPAQRDLEVGWQDFGRVEDVALVPQDLRVTPIDLGAGAPQVAQSSQVEDADGLRRSALLFEAGTDATMTLPDGTERPLDGIRVRSTEYTVGGAGTAAMPGELPAQSGYTYAAEFSLDEATKAHATNVEFTKPVVNYTDNFLGFPIGTPVPTGYYDREKGKWVASRDGWVIGIVSEAGGVAAVDWDGDGAADSDEALAEHRIDVAERRRLAELYDAGQSVWRVEIDHFTPWDHNWPYGPPPGAGGPGAGGPDGGGPEPDPCQSGGSVIECENQILGEDVDLVGTQFGLHYRSDRVPGRRAAYSLDVPLSGSSLPEDVQGIELEVQVAGRTYTRSFAAETNQRHTFTWDGKDAYGRSLAGAHEAKVRVGYTYRARYYLPCVSTMPRVAASAPARSTGGAAVTQPVLEPCFGNAFARFSSGQVTANRARQEVTIWQQHRATVGAWDARSAGLGGWTLSVHHSYDAVSRTINLGDGSRIGGEHADTLFTLDTLAGTGSAGFSGDGGAADEGRVNQPRGVAVAADGTTYVADTENDRVRKITRDGKMTTFAGTGAYGFAGDGGPATAAKLASPQGVEVGDDGSVYIADTLNHRVRRVGVDGVIRTVAGGGDPADGVGDGGRATQAKLRAPSGLAVGPDATLYVADPWQHRVRAVAQDGLISTVAGDGDAGFEGDRGPARRAELDSPQGVAVDDDGVIYVADTGNDRVRRIRPDGTITTVAGGGNPTGGVGDGTAATKGRLSDPTGVAVDLDGSLYVADTGHDRVRRVVPDGEMTSAAGAGELGGDGNPAAGTRLQTPAGVAVAPNGALVLSEAAAARVRRADLALGGFAEGDRLIAATSGEEAYLFTASGRHKRTIDTLTGQTTWTFGYDDGGRLSTVTDLDGEITKVERDEAGRVTGIVGPYGQRTALALDSAGYVAKITSPAGEAHTLVTGVTGLLQSFTDPRGGVTTFTYDADGRLVKDADRAGGFQALERTDSADGFSVVHSTKTGRKQTVEVERLGDGTVRRTMTEADGSTSVSERSADGTSTGTDATGMQVSVQQSADPRFGMQSPIASGSTVKLPSGRTMTASKSRSVTLEDPRNPLSLRTLTEYETVNGYQWQRTFDRANRRLTMRSPRGRQTVTLVDAKGRPTQLQMPGVEPISTTYDTRGRVAEVAQGTRTWSYTYDDLGRVETITDPLDRTRRLQHDLAGRVTKETMPDGREVRYAYDAKGNVASITPPSGSAHTFGRSLLDVPGDITSPPVGDEDGATTYRYDDDGRLTALVRPGGRETTFSYDEGGRPISTTDSQGTTHLGYDAATGQQRSIEAPGGERIEFATDGPLPTGETVSGTVAGRLARTYDGQMRVHSTTVNGGQQVTFSWDADGLLTRAGDLTLQRAAASGRLDGTTLAGVTTALGYNAHQQVTSLTAAAGSTALLSVELELDGGGRIVKRTETVEGRRRVYEYAYDAAARLSEVKLDGARLAAYGYDANGNRTSVTSADGTERAAEFDAQDRLVRDGTTTYRYRAAGELRERHDEATGERTTFDYGDDGQLRGVTLPDGKELSYVVDGLGRRVARKVGGTLDRGFLYEGQATAPVAELDGAGAVRSRFVYGTRSTVPDYFVRDGKAYRILTDEQGSVRLVVDAAAGTVVQALDYDPYGRVTRDTNPGFQPFGYAGGLYDHETGLVRFGARDYDAATGRWTTKDPIGFAGGDTNHYGYVLGDPINSVDPTGLIGWPSLQQVSDFAAGFGDSYTFGATKAIRGLLGANDAVNFCSGAYALGGVAGDLAPGPSKVKLLGRFGRGGRAAGPTALGIAPAKRNTGTTVLGRFPAYKDMSEATGARRFEMPTEIYNRLSPDEAWEANRKFLDRTIARGDDIVLATRPGPQHADSPFGREIRYLESKGYTVSPDGTRMVAPR